jgi:mitochondrial intermediate peptidase
MIGRSEYHNCSGTRCATDFVELPSILMEHFLQSPGVRSLFLHPAYSATKPMPSARARYASLETSSQIVMALLDQALHSSLPLNPIPGFSTQLTHQIQSTYGASIPAIPSTSWATRFFHLFGYGATYYSYLFDRAIAGEVYRVVFGAGERIGRHEGEKYKEEVLKWGGERDPWRCIEGVLDMEEESLRMDDVGKWGVEETKAD